MSKANKIRLVLSPQARRYAGPDAPLDARRLAARGALPLPPIDLVTVLFALLHDSDLEVKSRARESLEGLPDEMCAAVASGPAHPAVLSYLAHSCEDREELLEKIALNPETDDQTIAHLASLPYRRLVDVIANNQQRMLRCPEIVEALGENSLTGRAVIDRILSFLGIHRPEAESDDLLDDEPTSAEEITDDTAAAALRALLGDDFSDFNPDLVRELADELTPEEQGNLSALVQQMSVMQKIKLARMGNREARGLLLRDHNKIVATAAIRSPKITDNEITQVAKMRNVSDEVIRVIASNREWTKNYQVKLALATNPKCPQPTAMKFLNHVQDRDLRKIMKSKDVPTSVSTHARRILSRKGKI